MKFKNPILNIIVIEISFILFIIITSDTSVKWRDLLLKILNRIFTYNLNRVYN